ncbi:MAG: DUF1343 domain-containing protein [Desulfobulbaceae bacterium]|nr:DUF1343 domain-containing protein [Candidatus Kapabacteria bacterium]MBS4001448.1 DUF1343 domain-containing protein [Desulfobulbaceae bacterium]
MMNGQFRILFIIIFLSNTIIALSQQTILTGIDVLQSESFSSISGKKILLLSNSTGRNSNGQSTLEILSKSNKFEFLGVLAPEHGYYTAVPAGQTISEETIDGIKIYSIYGSTKEPDKGLMKHADAIVVDIQDIGVRSYTYISSLHRTMKAAAQSGKQIIVLDRPNPIGGLIVDGNVLEQGMESFVGAVQIPYIHGLTIGELALMINDEGWLGVDANNSALKCDLQVIRMTGWHRWMTWEDTGLMWFPTSPHIPTPDAVRGIACLGIYGEIGLMSIGIGSTSPFQYLGNPNFNPKAVLRILEKESLYGLHLSQSRFQPFYGMYSNRSIEAILLRFTPNQNFRPYTWGLKLILAVREVHPDLFRSETQRAGIDMFHKVTGTKDLYNALFNNLPDDVILKIANRGVEAFIKLRSKYFLY